MADQRHLLKLQMVYKCSQIGRELWQAVLAADRPVAIAVSAQIEGIEAVVGLKSFC